MASLVSKSQRRVQDARRLCQNRRMNTINSVGNSNANQLYTDAFSLNL